MKYVLIFSGIILFSCKTVKGVPDIPKKYNVLIWQKQANYFDIYCCDTLMAMNMPCTQTNKMILHNYPPGHYKFVFRLDKTEIETVKIEIK
jgi:hypothetical protein